MTDDGVSGAERRGRLAARVAFALGAAADALWSIALFFPPLFGALTGQPGFRSDPDIRSIMAVGGALMAGWTVLLLWGYRKPIERRFLLLLTAGVVLALLGIELVGFLRGDPAGLWILGKTTLLLWAMAYGYRATAHQAATAGASDQRNAASTSTIAAH